MVDRRVLEAAVAALTHLCVRGLPPGVCVAPPSAVTLIPHLVVWFGFAEESCVLVANAALHRLIGLLSGDAVGVVVRRLQRFEWDLL